jgi:hypothetical protein
VKLAGFAKSVPKDSPAAGRWTSSKYKGIILDFNNNFLFLILGSS